MKLGYIDYLNCYPFYYHMLVKQPVDGVEIVPGYPSMLNRMMSSGEVDMSPISSATCADIAQDVLVLPDFCLSSVGYVSSVVLFSNMPIEDLNGKTIALSGASHTSVVLLKILLAEYYNVTPHFIPTEPMPVLSGTDGGSDDGVDAALVIGNEAMTFNTSSSMYAYDLGELWLDKTGFPVVFAVFAVRRDAVEQYARDIEHVISSYHKSLKYLAHDKDDLYIAAAKKYPTIQKDIKTYYNLLQFEFTDSLKKALMFYFDKSGQLGLTKKVTSLDFFTG